MDKILVFRDRCGEAFVLDIIGDNVELELENSGSDMARWDYDLDVYGHILGLWVWEGKYVEAGPEGTWRKPTEDEIRNLAEGKPVFGK